MLSTNLSLLLLAASPVIVVTSFTAVLFREANAWLILPSFLLVYGPLLHLTLAGSFPRKVRRRVRRLLMVATGSVVLAVLGAAAVLSPRFLLQADPGPPAITLAPALRQQGTFDVNGLNVRWAPRIERAPPNAGYFFGFDMSRKGGSIGGKPPQTIEDKYGNHVIFTEVRPGVLRLEDNLGGFAEVDWNGANPVLVASLAFPRTAAARGPAPFTWRAVGLGQLLLFMAPLTAWTLLTLAFIQLTDSALLGMSLLCQGAGLVVCVVLLLFLLSGGTSGPESGIANAYLTLFLLGAACLASGIGLIFMSLSLLHESDIM